MKQTLIKITDDHYVVVDDSEIKFGDWFLTDDKRIEQSAPDWNAMEWHRKITHSTLPLEDVMGLTNKLDAKGWVLIKLLHVHKIKELLGKVDLEKKITKKLEELPYTKHLDDGQYNDGQLVGFELGARWAYNQAIEDNKDKKYTEMDMKKAFYKGIDSWMQNPDAIESIIHDFRHSLQPKTEWEVTFDDQGKLKLV